MHDRLLRRSVLGFPRQCVLAPAGAALFPLCLFIGATVQLQNCENLSVCLILVKASHDANDSAAVQLPVF